MFAILKRSINHNKFQFKRNKITVSSLEASETAKIRRPTPILFLRTDNDNSKEWTNNCQKELCSAGYTSFDAFITLPNQKNEEQTLQTCYQELSQATSELSFFPPLLIGKGENAWRICQKYVSNKPVSGLVLVEEEESNHVSSLPSHEFEPFFPILMISGKVPPFLDGWVDHYHQGNMKEILQWMDEAGL